MASPTNVCDHFYNNNKCLLLNKFSTVSHRNLYSMEAETITWLHMVVSCSTDWVEETGNSTELDLYIRFFRNAC